MRVRVPRPRRTFLEMDELVAFIEAAEAQDRSPDVAVPLTANRTRPGRAKTAAGARPTEIAAELGLAKSTVAFPAQSRRDQPRPYAGRRAIIETLGRAGSGQSELYYLRLGDVRVGDGRLVIRDAKTEAGVREVQMTPTLVDATTSTWPGSRRRLSDRRRRVRSSPRGNLSTRQRIGCIVREASQPRRAARGAGAAAAADDAAHLRRTYISIALVANSFDVKWVDGPGRPCRLEDDDGRHRSRAAR